MAVDATTSAYLGDNVHVAVDAVEGTLVLMTGRSEIHLRPAAYQALVLYAEGVVGFGIERRQSEPDKGDPHV